MSTDAVDWPNPVGELEKHDAARSMTIGGHSTRCDWQSGEACSHEPDCPPEDPVTKFRAGDGPKAEVVGLEVDNPERLAYARWRASAVAMQAAFQAFQAAKAAHDKALAELGNVVAPVNG